MATKRLDKIFNQIESEDQFNDYIKSDKLLVLDVHREWCGPCAAMRQTFETIYINTDECEERLIIARINIDKYKSLLEPYCSEFTCRPLFLIFKGGQLIHTVENANATLLTEIIHSNMPPAPDTEIHEPTNE